MIPQGRGEVKREKRGNFCSEMGEVPLAKAQRRKGPGRTGTTNSTNSTNSIHRLRHLCFPANVNSYVHPYHYLCRFAYFNRQERQERQEVPFFYCEFLLFLIIFRLTEQEKVQG